MTPIGASMFPRRRVPPKRDRDYGPRREWSASGLIPQGFRKLTQARGAVVSFVLHLVKQTGEANKSYAEYADILKMSYNTVARAIDDAVELKILSVKRNPVKDASGRIAHKNAPNTITVINEKVRYWLNRGNRTEASAAKRVRKAAEVAAIAVARGDRASTAINEGAAAGGAPQLRGTLLNQKSNLEGAIGKLREATTPWWVKTMLVQLARSATPVTDTT